MLLGFGVLDFNSPLRGATRRVGGGFKLVFIKEIFMYGYSETWPLVIVESETDRKGFNRMTSLDNYLCECAFKGKKVVCEWIADVPMYEPAGIDDMDYDFCQEEAIDMYDHLKEGKAVFSLYIEGRGWSSEFYTNTRGIYEIVKWATRNNIRYRYFFEASSSVVWTNQNSCNGETDLTWDSIRAFMVRWVE